MNFWLTFFLLGGLDDSVILANDASMISQLNTWLLPHLQSPEKSYWKLCYRASIHGWRSRTFHNYCDNKGPTVTIIRVGIYIFGGYNDNSWKCKSGNMEIYLEGFSWLRFKSLPALPCPPSPITPVYQGGGVGPLQFSPVVQNNLFKTSYPFNDSPYLSLERIVRSTSKNICV